MKSFLIGLVIVCAVVIAGTVIYLNHQKVSPAPAVVTSSSPAGQAESGKNVILKSEESPAVLTDTNEMAQIPVTNSTPAKLKPETELSRLIDILVSTNASFQQKQAVWKQLRDAGELDQVIAALKQGETDNPGSIEYPINLGVAELQKAGDIFKNGGSPDEMGILGMQADQSFDAALKIDPANWGAQFMKAQNMSYWPLELNKGQEVIQRFSALIDQQDTMSPQPQFAQTYLMLGNEYQKMNEPDKAEATWRLGLSIYPNDSSLQGKVNGQ
jgi:hypothetical protein